MPGLLAHFSSRADITDSSGDEMENTDGTEAGVTRAEFARQIDSTPSYITNLIKEGRIVLDENGRVLPLASKRRMIETHSGVKRTALIKRIAKQVSECDAGKPQHSVDPVCITPELMDEEFDFQQERARKEHYQAELAKQELEQKSRALVRRELVEQAARRAGEAMRTEILSVPLYISPELARMSKPIDIERRLDEALRKVLDDVASMTWNDIQSAIERST